MENSFLFALITSEVNVHFHNKVNGNERNIKTLAHTNYVGNTQYVRDTMDFADNNGHLRASTRVKRHKNKQMKKNCIAMEFKSREHNENKCVLYKKKRNARAAYTHTHTHSNDTAVTRESTE